MDRKAACGQLNLAHVTKNRNVGLQKKKLKQTNASTHLIRSIPRSVKVVQMEPGMWRRGFVKEMSFKTGVKGRGSDRW